MAVRLQQGLIQCRCNPQTMLTIFLSYTWKNIIIRTLSVTVSAVINVFSSLNFINYLNRKWNEQKKILKRFLSFLVFDFIRTRYITKTEANWNPVTTINSIENRTHLSFYNDRKTIERNRFILYYYFINSYDDEISTMT